jgi:hypothetical protein
MGEYEQRIPHGGGANGHICHDTADDGAEELMMKKYPILLAAACIA